LLNNENEGPDSDFWHRGYQFLCFAKTIPFDFTIAVLITHLQPIEAKFKNSHNMEIM
jgi:hypothetical protein